METPKTPKEWEEITEEDWDRMESEFGKFDHLRETRWESFKWEINYNYRSFKTFIREIKQGLWNLWFWRKEIYRNRWYDHQFLFDIQKKQLCYMKSQWHKSYGLHSFYQQEILNELCEILDRIERLEDEYEMGWSEKQDEINSLYQEFGRKLYDTRNEEIKATDSDGKVHIQKINCSAFEMLWD